MVTQLKLSIGVLHSLKMEQKLKKQEAATGAAFGCGGKASAAVICSEKLSSRSQRFF